MHDIKFGTLYIVATPIGNLSDITLRALEILKKVNLIAAEDTRHAKQLLNHYAIATPLIAFHEHNERQITDKLINNLKNGESIALISDAGTPLLSDPGFFLVRQAKLAGITVIPIPGACAAIAALSASGLATNNFVFEGFLPVKKIQLENRLQELSSEKRTLIFYEAPHRILKTLEALKNVFGAERKAVLARELTKTFETIKLTTLEELYEWVKNDANQQRGEIVLLVEGSETQSPNVDLEAILQTLLEDLPLKKAVEIATKLTNFRKNEIYETALKMQGKDKD